MHHFEQNKRQVVISLKRITNSILLVGFNCTNQLLASRPVPSLPLNIRRYLPLCVRSLLGGVVGKIVALDGVEILYARSREEKFEPSPVSNHTRDVKVRNSPRFLQFIRRTSVAYECNRFGV